jgi:hypothetical protein
MDAVVLTVFILVYSGMLLGRVPGLALDRTGVALLGAIVLLAAGRVTPEAAWQSVDVPTIGLLLGLMVISAQLRLGGLYSAVTRRVAAAEVAPSTLLGLVVAVAAVLSAFLANDIVCLAMAPLLVDGCVRRRLDPKPFLLALACAANVGSAATLIGNPQNMLIGQKLGLSFRGYLLEGGVPALLGCGVVWWVIRWSVRAAWDAAPREIETQAPPFALATVGNHRQILFATILIAAIRFRSTIDSDFCSLALGHGKAPRLRSLGKLQRLWRRPRGRGSSKPPGRIQRLEKVCGGAKDCGQGERDRLGRLCRLCGQRARRGRARPNGGATQSPGCRRLATLPDRRPNGSLHCPEWPAKRPAGSS